NILGHNILRWCSCPLLDREHKELWEVIDQGKMSGTRRDLQWKVKAQAILVRTAHARTDSVPSWPHAPHPGDGRPPSGRRRRSALCRDSAFHCGVEGVTGGWARASVAWCARCCAGLPTCWESFATAASPGCSDSPRNCRQLERPSTSSSAKYAR